MAGTTAADLQNNSPFFLDPNQQDLLLAALSSNQVSNDLSNDPLLAGFDYKSTRESQHTQFPVYPPLFDSAQQNTQTSAFGGNVEESPFADYLDGDANLDFDHADGALMIGALPGEGSEIPEKRKMSDSEADEEEGGGKRREGDEKQAKKPGRKPLTSEPTTKRKAQNRAAQRAFRERKEKHLKDLETKVGELEKASDATNQENGLLRAQVQRLQVELREYRKRLSLTSSNPSRSPSSVSSFNAVLGNGLSGGNFHFDFPRFGGLPASQYLNNGAANKMKASSTISTQSSVRQNSSDRSASPASTNNQSLVNSPQQLNNGFGTAATSSSAGNGLFDLYKPTTTSFKPTTTNAASASINGVVSRHPPSASSNASGAQARVFRFNSGPSSNHSDSPSASSNSAGMNSSCDTSPEPSHDSPKQAGSATLQAPVAPASNATGIDFYVQQNGGQFDPTLFGDYRDSQAAIVGDGDFTNGFFADAFPLTDYGSPFHFGDTPAIQKSNPLEQIEKLQDGVDHKANNHGASQMPNCQKIWDKIGQQTSYLDGTLDIDGLCSEFRARARCSDADVEAALKRATK